MTAKADRSVMEANAAANASFPSIGLAPAAAPGAPAQPAADLSVDTANGNSPYNVVGTVSFNNVFVGTISGGTVIHINSNTLNASELVVGRAAAGTYDLAGTATLNAGFVIVGQGGTGIFNQSANSFANISTDVQVGMSSFSGTYNLDGGTLRAQEVFGFGSASTFNFNSGTLQAAGNDTDFFSNFITAQVRNGGAVFDSNSFNVTISQALVHSTISGDNAIDGGLTKNGAGALTMTAQNSYTGATTVNAGTLILGDGTHALTLNGRNGTDGNINFFNGTNGTVSVTVNGGAFEVQAQSSARGGTGGAGINAQGAGVNTHGAGFAGNGAVAVIVPAGGSVINAGTIHGGNGGKGGNGDVFGDTGTDGGTGADAVTFSLGGTLINSGSIVPGAGGAGGTFGGNPGSGGIGARFSGAAGMFENDNGGSISGSVVMGNFGNNVILEIGSTIAGALNISSNASSALTLTDNGAGGTQAYSGAVSGATTFNGSLVKRGTGTWTLDLPLSYAGTTDVDAGTLELPTSGSITSSAKVASIAAGATLNIDGGSVSLGTAAGGDLRVGTTANNNTLATALLSAGSLSTFNSIIGYAPGSNGSFSQSSGTHTVAGQLFVAYDPDATSTSAPPTGSYTLSGGQLSTPNTQVGNGGTGTFTQSGGTQTITSTLYLGVNGGSGTYNLEPGGTLAAANADVGFSSANNRTGNGSFIQTGGSFTLTSTLFVGYDPNATSTSIFPTGGYTLSAGQLSTGSTQVGNGGTGTFTQSGGTHTITGQLLVGVNGGSGIYNLQAGSLSASFVDLGDTGGNSRIGTGTFNQSGGTLTIANDLLLGVLDANTAGTYNLNGGTLTTFLVGRGPGSGTFNFNGGTLQATQDIGVFLQGLTTANVRDGGAIIDSAGHSITIAQNLLHSTINGDAATDGGLTKNGLGTLSLTGANTYTGGTSVNAGTLLVNNTAGSGTGAGAVAVAATATLGGGGTISGPVTVQSGGTLAPGNSPGQITIANNLSLLSGSSFSIELRGTTPGTGYDQVLMSGQLTLAGNLNVTLLNGFTPTIGFSFAIVDNSATNPTIGMFANAPGGIYTSASGIWLVNYAANTDTGLIPNDLTLTYLSAIPEPSTWTLMVVAGLAFGLLRFRKQRG